MFAWWNDLERLESVQGVLGIVLLIIGSGTAILLVFQFFVDRKVKSLEAFQGQLNEMQQTALVEKAADLEKRAVTAEKQLAIIATDRHITPEQRSAIVTGLKEIGRQPIRVLTPNHDNESRQYGREILDLFLEANWDVPKELPVTVVDGAVDGIQILFKSEEDSPPWGPQVQRIFIDSGIHVIPARMDDLKPGEIWFAIGRKRLE